ncbi:MAG: methyltransferase domain-containing protein [Planctomycetes bacterium]|nr:methyltransferase domain-containing protein [Planctomycetota bacterium]
MSLVYKISAYNRRKKWRLFYKEIAPTQGMHVLDVGFQEEEYSSTDNFIEKHYPYPEMLTALGINIPVKFKTRYPTVTVVHYDGGLFPFGDKAFDVLWSNAVIEHAGDRNKQLLFIKEIKRVSKRAFITTPNKFFPIELHTRTPLLHYLPKRIFDKYLVLIRKRWATGEYMHPLSHNDIKALLADAGISEYKIINNRLGGITMDFVVLF